MTLIYRDTTRADITATAPVRRQVQLRQLRKDDGSRVCRGCWAPGDNRNIAREIYSAGVAPTPDIDGPRCWRSLSSFNVIHSAAAVEISVAYTATNVPVVPNAKL